MLQWRVLRWRVLRWLVPDLAFATAFITLFYCLFLFQGYQQLFRDSDAGWHIRNGETILATRALPRTDTYSFTRAGQPWYAWEWLADVAVGALHRSLGLNGVAVFYAAAISAGVWLWFRLHWALGGNFLIACAMAPLLLSTCSIHWLARPHVLSWIFLLLAIFPRRPNLIAVAIVTALWANIHASFFMALAIALIFLGQELLAPERLQTERLQSEPRPSGSPEGLRPTNGSEDTSSEPRPSGSVGQLRDWQTLPYGRGSDRSDLQRSVTAPATQWQRSVTVAALMRAYYLKAFAVAAIAPLLNPYGPKLYVHVYRYLTDSELLSRIGEFQSFDFHSPGSGQIIAALIVGIAGGTLALTERRFHHFALAVLVTAMALRSARALPLCALLLLPIANAAITNWVAAITNRGCPFLARALAYGDNLRTLDARFLGLALAPAVVAAAYWLTPPAAFPPDQFPVAAYTHIPSGARLFAPDKFGGYLIYRSNGALKVFFDGRSDLYGADFLRKYARLMQVRPGWRDYWESIHFTHALVPADAPLLPALEQIGWRPVYRDKTATLLASP